MTVPESGNRQLEISRMTLLGQSGGESVQLKAQPSPLATEYCVQLLHDLNNVFASVLINAQVLDGKMPSYSRSKRYIHEIERSAQRGGALLKRLLERLPGEVSVAGDKEFELGKVPPVAEPQSSGGEPGADCGYEWRTEFCASDSGTCGP